MKKRFEKVLTCPMMPNAILSNTDPYNVENALERLIILEKKGFITSAKIVGYVCRRLNIHYYPWYRITIKKITNSPFYQVTLWEEKNHVVNENAHPIEMPISLIRRWVDTNVGYDNVGPYLQLGERMRLYENNMVGKWAKETIFDNANPLRFYAIRLVKVDVEKSRVRFEAAIADTILEGL